MAIKSLSRSGSDPQRAESARRIIYERAIDLFDAKGFRGASMNEIALSCGVSKPALYHYFRDKSHLLEMLYSEVTGEIFLAMEKLAHSSEDAVTRLRQLIEMQTVHNIENRRFLTIFWRERHEFNEASRKSLAVREREFEAWVTRIVTEGQADGELAPGDPKVATMGILGMLSTVHRWAQHVGKSPQEVGRELGRLVLDGMILHASAPKRPAGAPARKTTRPRKAPVQSGEFA